MQHFCHNFYTIGNDQVMMKWEKWDRHPQMLSSSCILLLLSLFKLIITQYTGAAQLVDLLQQLSNSDSSPSWVSSHGSVLTISSLLRHNPFLITSAEFPLLADCLKDGLQDERVFSVLMPLYLLVSEFILASVNQFPVRETSTKVLERLILHQIQRDPSKTFAYVGF